MFWIVIVLSLFSIVKCVNIGEIDNYIMVDGIMNNSLLNRTKDECICQMVKSNEFIFALNYFHV